MLSTVAAYHILLLHLVVPVLATVQHAVAKKTASNKDVPSVKREALQYKHQHFLTQREEVIPFLALLRHCVADLFPQNMYHNHTWVILPKV
jgi:hypothetical protein